jgi:predicted nucleic acid-binding protein
MAEVIAAWCVRRTGAWLEQAVELYRKSIDKSWSLTDCLSIVVMREEKLIDALTADHHFMQAGFRALLIES